MEGEWVFFGVFTDTILRCGLSHQRWTLSEEVIQEGSLEACGCDSCPREKSGIVYSSSRKIVGSPLGLGHLFLTNRLFTEKHDFCWPENMPEFNPHLQSCLSCWVFFFPQGQMQINLFPQG